MKAIVVQRMDHVALDITDVDRAKAFYGGLLGLREVPRPASFDFPGAWYDIGNAVLHLVGRPEKDPLSRRHFALWVENCHQAAEALKAAGCPVLWESKYKIIGVDRFFTADPDDNRVEIQGAD